MSIKILVVDDEADLADLIRQKFRRQIRARDYEFLFAGNGEEALKQLVEHDDVDLVLTDINMPVMDGLTLLLKMMELNRLTKAVVVSAYGDLGNIRTAMNRGAFDFLTKPIDFPDLEITISRTISQLQQAKEAAKDHEQLNAIRQELTIAGSIQASLMPRSFPAIGDQKTHDVYAEMTPALEVGGDFYDFFLISATKLGVVVGDVSGKGIPAAIFMALARTMIKATALQGVDAAMCLRNVNRLLCRDNEHAMFVTTFYGILDLASGELNYCNAGHNPAYHIRDDGHIDILPRVGGLSLGVEEDAEYRSHQVVLNPREAVFLYTDGLNEANNPTDQLFGDDRLRNSLAAHGSSPARELVQNVLKDVRDFVSGARQSDDIAALAVRFLGTLS